MNSSRMQSTTETTIIGTGAIAAWLGHELISTGTAVKFCDRGDTPEKWSWNIIYNQIVHSHTAAIDSTSLKMASNIFVAVRSHSLPEIWTTRISSLPHLDGRSICVCSNGFIEPELEKWQRERPEMIVNLGVITSGITRVDDHTFERKDDNGRLFLGPVLSTTNPDDQFHGFPECFEYDPAIRDRARKKWLFNTAANTVAGVYALDCNQRILSNHYNLLRELFDEAFDLASEMWSTWRQEATDHPAHREILWLELRQLLIDTRHNQNSMAAAVRRGDLDALGEAMLLGGLAFTHSGYPALKFWTRKLLQASRNTHP